MKNANLRSFALAVLFVAVGLIVFGYKAFVAGFPLSPDQTVKSWHIEAKITLNGNYEKSRAELKLPDSSDRFTLLDEGFISDGYGFYVTQPDTSRQVREAIWTKRKAKEKEIIFYRAVVYESRDTDQEKALDAEAIKKYYIDEASQKFINDETAQTALDSLHQEFLSKSSDEFSYTTAALKTLLNASDERLKLIRVKLGHTSDLSSAATQILRHGGIAARTVNLLQLSKGERDAEIVRRTEVFLNGKWMRFNAETATLDQSKNVMPWWTGDEKVLHVSGGSGESSIRFAVKQHLESALTEAIWDGDGLKNLFYTSSVFGLPVDLQLTLQILLLIPLGAFVCAFLKQFIGITTYGTFMPVLIAMSFRETQLIWGIVLFCFIIGLGMLFRSVFDKLQLLMVPRLAAILTVVVAIIYAISLVLFKFRIQSGLSISLFPLVILTMLIERMSVTWEERGAREALHLALNSLLISVLCYFVISNTYIIHLLITFPELLLVILGFCLALGRYNGFKLTEYYRFRVLK